MSQINVVGVLKGGLAAGLRHEHQRVHPERAGGRGTDGSGVGVAQPAASRMRGAQIAVFVGSDGRCSDSSPCGSMRRSGRGSGPGPKTAMCAGLIVWACSYLYAAITIGTVGDPLDGTGPDAHRLVARGNDHRLGGRRIPLHRVVITFVGHRRHRGH